jgi:hypothetical protein
MWKSVKQLDPWRKRNTQKKKMKETWGALEMFIKNQPSSFFASVQISKCWVPATNVVKIKSSTKAMKRFHLSSHVRAERKIQSSDFLASVDWARMHEKKTSHKTSLAGNWSTGNLIQVSRLYKYPLPPYDRESKRSDSIGKWSFTNLKRTSQDNPWSLAKNNSWSLAKNIHDQFMKPWKEQPWPWR